MADLVERTFGVRAAGSTLGREALGGATTFVTMAYILFVNSAILGAAGLDPAAVLTSTALVAGVMSIAMGIVAGYPFAAAPGMGINAAVAGSLVAAQGLSPAEAMGVVVAEGIAITLLVFAGVREAVLDAIPRSLKLAIGAGIGLFLAVIGLAGGGLVVAGQGTLVALGDLGAPSTQLFLVGLALGFGLVARGVRGALLIAIAVVTALAMVAGHVPTPSAFVAVPDFSLVGDVSVGFVDKLGVLAAILAVFSLMLSDFFDTIGTAVGLGTEGKFLDREGRLPRMKRVLLVDSLAAVAGGLVSSSSATTYIESASGIAAGARTGLASVVTGLIFLAAMFIAPLAGVVPGAATASALVVVGYLMASMLRELDWRDVPSAAPAFLCALGMPLTWSISNGIGAGVIAHVVLAAFSGRARTVHPLLWATAAAFLAFFALA